MCQAKNDNLSIAFIEKYLKETSTEANITTQMIFSPAIIMNATCQHHHLAIETHKSKWYSEESAEEQTCFVTRAITLVSMSNTVVEVITSAEDMQLMSSLEHHFQKRKA